MVLLASSIRLRNWLVSHSIASYNRLAEALDELHSAFWPISVPNDLLYAAVGISRSK